MMRVQEPGVGLLALFATDTFVDAPLKHHK
jgi:hypothetical protein